MLPSGDGENIMFAGSGELIVLKRLGESILPGVAMLGDLAVSLIGVAIAMSGTSNPMLWTSTASMRAFSLSSRSKQPVPMGHSWPKIMFSDTPCMMSTSAFRAARSKISTVSSKLHWAIGLFSLRLIP